MMKILPFALSFILLAIPAFGKTVLPPIQTVFLIVLENANWSDIEGSTNAPFLNDVLLPMSSYCRQYYNPPGMHPSEPNYLWLLAGTNFGITNDADPSVNAVNTSQHLIDHLRNAGISWKAYEEDISGTYVPLTFTNNYVPRHDPFVYFDDITGTNDPGDAYAIAHIRPYDELAADLTNDTVAQYNFITPNLCDDGHNVCAPEENSLLQIDDWLTTEIPRIMDSAAYSNNGAIFITWDEGEPADGPIGMIVLSPLARGGGYISNTYFTHSSCLRTMQEIFNVSPLLGDAANATDLSELFRQLNLVPVANNTAGMFSFSVTNVIPGTTNLIEASTDLTSWTVVATNLSSSNSFIFTGTTTNHSEYFYRIQQE